MGDSGAHVHQRLALEAAADPLHLAAEGCGAKTSDPGAGDFVGLTRRIVIGILHPVHAGRGHGVSGGSQ